MCVRMSFNQVSLAAVMGAVLAAAVGIATAPAQELVRAEIATAANNSQSLARVAPSVEPVRNVEMVGEVSGSEPDPEAFDRAGLEAWWHNYERQYLLRADASAE